VRRLPPTATPSGDHQKPHEHATSLLSHVSTPADDATPHQFPPRPIGSPFLPFGGSKDRRRAENQEFGLSSGSCFARRFGWSSPRWSSAPSRFPASPRRQS